MGGPGASGYDADMEDILAQMFASMGAGGMPQPPPGGAGFSFGGPQGRGQAPAARSSVKKPKSADESTEYDVTLEDLYRSKTARFTATKAVLCTHCRATGAKERAKKIQCSTCDGQGSVRATISLGPGLVIPQNRPCSKCDATGLVWRTKDLCRKCNGARTTSSKKLLELYIPPGARDGERITLAGEADYDPDALAPGDLVFVLRCASHKTFTRKGDDLCAEIHVSLGEALTGLADNRVVVTHLDGRDISLGSKKGLVLRPGTVLKVPGEGMPVKKGASKGDLYLIVNVDFPKDGFLDGREGAEALRRILPARKTEEKKEVDGKVEEVDEREFEVSALDGFGGGEADADWEDDSSEMEGENVPQCATQ
jgi:DnaJ family protein A protein 2